VNVIVTSHQGNEPGDLATVDIALQGFRKAFQRVTMTSAPNHWKQRDFVPTTRLGKN
jgi:hypothetical protein